MEEGREITTLLERAKPGKMVALCTDLKPSIQTVCPHHPNFDVDEQSIILARKMYILIAFDYINSSH